MTGANSGSSRSPRIATADTHGTGCTYSAAIATALAFGKDVAGAVAEAKRYITEAVRHAWRVGGGHGPTNHLAPLFRFGRRDGGREAGLGGERTAEGWIMEEKTQLSGVNLFFLWFGAAVSVAEILTGGYLAELGAVKGLWAILLGHLAGTLLLVLAGLIGFRERLPAIMSTRISFGKQGSYLISLINILQLVGWTAIMIIEGGTAMNVIAAPCGISTIRP